jgi:hypothetical protein
VIVKAGNNLIPVERIKRIDISDVENEVVVLYCDDGKYVAEGFDAIEAVMVLKPSALEGRRLRWRKGAWAFHNIVGHPVMQILAWFGFGRAAVRFHDRTTPRPR